MRQIIEQDNNTDFSSLISVLFLIGRILIAFAFMSLALGLILYFEDARETAQCLGVSAVNFYCIFTIVFNFLGAVSIALGFKTRIGAAMLIICLIPTIFLFYGSEANKINLAGSIAIVGGLLPFLALGPGPFSFDCLPKTRKQRFRRRF